MLAASFNIVSTDLSTIAIFAALAAFYIWMIIDCATQEKVPVTRNIWLLVIIAIPLGSLVYFVCRKLPRYGSR